MAAPQIDFKKLDEIMKAGKFTILDVREAGELQADGKIPISVHVPVGDINSFPQKVNCAKSDAIVVYCKSGMRASKGAAQLMTMGYTKVFVFPGGVREWMANQK